MTYLQNIYEWKKLLAWDDAGPREIAREALPAGAGPYFPGHYAPIEGRFVGVKPSPDGPVYFDDDKEVPLLPGRYTTSLERSADRVRFRLLDGEIVVSEVTYRPDPVLEFDPYEGQQGGLFEWLVEQIPLADFYARLTH